MIEFVGFDGDDTLWHHESLFSDAQERFRALLAGYAPPESIDERLLATEKRNLEIFGYGIKGFTLSMIETAIELSGARVGSAEIQALIDLGKEMLAHPVELLPGVDEVLRKMSERWRLVLVTKGDLFDQESKIARSGLAGHFWRVEIVSEKDPQTLSRLLARNSIEPGRFVMVGNSVRSDVMPALAVGARAVHIPYHITWSHEAAEPPRDEGGFWELKDMSGLPALVEKIA